jgi:hypothetical protein
MFMALRNPPPAENDLLCEACGYILNGLQTEQGNCPECGTPTRESLEPGNRIPSPIEEEWSSKNFWTTTSRVLLQKRRFFRETRTRDDHLNVTRFGRLHRWMSGILLGLAGGIHAAWMAETQLWVTRWDAVSLSILAVAALVLTLLAVATLSLVTRLATWLTSKEGAFWGMRLPSSVVTRAMSFHSANYLPVGILAFLLTFGYRIGLMSGWTDASTGVKYLIALCILVVSSAVWLFESYVVAMRRIRLANF